MCSDIFHKSRIKNFRRKAYLVIYLIILGTNTSHVTPSKATVLQRWEKQTRVHVVCECCACLPLFSAFTFPTTLPSACSIKTNAR